MNKENIYWNKDLKFFDLSRNEFEYINSKETICNLITEINKPVSESYHDLRFDYIFAKIHSFLTETSIRDDNVDDFDLAFVERLPELIDVIGKNGMETSKFNRFLILENLIKVMNEVFWFWGNIGTGPHGNGCGCILCQHQ